MVAVQACFPIGALLATLIYYLSKDWWTTTLYVILIPSIATLILMMIFIQETPMFLIRKGPAKALKVLNKIGKINKSK